MCRNRDRKCSEERRLQLANHLHVVRSLWLRSPDILFSQSTRSQHFEHWVTYQETASKEFLKVF